MGKKRRAMKNPAKFSGKFGNKFATFFKLQAEQGVVEEAVKPEPVIEEPAPAPVIPKSTKKAPTKEI